MISSDYPSTETSASFHSNNFSIVAPAITNPSITVTSPNGGETFTSGQSIPVKWNMNYANTSASVVVRLLKDGSGNVFDSQPIQGTSGSNTFSIPAGTVGAGSYRAEVVDNPGFGGQNTYDDGDSYFTVSAPVPPCLNGAGALLPGQTYCAGSGLSANAISGSGQTIGSIQTNNLPCTNIHLVLPSSNPSASLDEYWNGTDGVLGVRRGTSTSLSWPTVFLCSNAKFYACTWSVSGNSAATNVTTGTTMAGKTCTTSGWVTTPVSSVVSNSNVASVDIAFEELMKLIRALR